MFTSPKFYNLVEAVVYIAMHAKPNAVRGTEICKAQGLPERYLEADLQELVHSGVLRSVRGPKGGYVLAKERRNITLADVYKVLVHKDKTKPTSFAQNHLQPIMSQVEETAVAKLAAITIEELCGKASSNAPAQKGEFTI